MMEHIRGIFAEVVSWLDFFFSCKFERAPETMTVFFFHSLWLRGGGFEGEGMLSGADHLNRQLLFTVTSLVRANVNLML